MAFGIGSKLKKGLGSIANKVADKLIPKELAPFLPMLAPLFMGPGAGLMSRYLIPQLLTALSTGKTTGGISGTSQGLAGLSSFLSDPSRLKLAEPIEAKDAVAAKDAIPSGMETTMDPTSQRVVMGTLEDGVMVPDPSRPVMRTPVIGQESVPMTVGDLPKNFTVDGKAVNIIDAQAFDPTTGTSPFLGGGEGTYMALPDSGQLKVGFGPGQVPPRGYTIPAVEAQAAVQAQPLTKFDTFKNTLKTGVNEARDFIQGTNVANKRPFGEEVTVEEGSKLIGKGKFDPYNQSYNEFKKNPLDTYAVGDAINVQDAGFGYNMPRRAVQQGLLSTGPGMAVANKMKADAAAEEAAQQASFDNYYDSRQALFDYFGNAKPNYGMLYGGFANGGRIGYQDGTDEMGVQGLNYEGFEPGGGMMDALMAVLKNKLKGDPMGTGEPNIARRAIYDALGIDYATGGRVNKNVGGISQLPAGMPPGSQVDGRNGTFIPMGVKEKADDVPAMLSKNEFVMTADAVRAAGGGSVEKGAQRMYDLMNSLEARV